MINEYEDKRKEKFLEKFIEFGKISDACRETGVSRNTFKKWKQEDVNFFEDWEDSVRYLNELNHAFELKFPSVYHNINK